MKNAKVLSALGLMSLASTAALAASGPTLGSVLDASGVKVSGNVAASFNQNISVSPQADNAKNSFQVDQALLSIAYLPKNGFGAAVDVASGDYNPQGGRFATGSDTALTQAYVQYNSGALTVQGGRFYTAAGYEVFPVTGNLFVSRSETFGQESTYHTGLRASYAATDALTVNVGVNDGIYNNLDNENSLTKNKAFELGATLAVSSDLSLALTTYTGKDAALDKQSLYSLVASYNVNKDISLALNVDMVKNSNSTVVGNGKATNVALYATYAVSDKVKAGLRVEEVNPEGSKNNIGAVAAVVSYAAAKNFDLRTELKDVDAQGAKRMVTGAVQGVLKF